MALNENTLATIILFTDHFIILVSSWAYNRNRIISPYTKPMQTENSVMNFPKHFL